MLLYGNDPLEVATPNVTDYITLQDANVLLKLLDKGPVSVATDTGLPVSPVPSHCKACSVHSLQLRGRSFHAALRRRSSLRLLDGDGSTTACVLICEDAVDTEALLRAFLLDVISDC